MENCEKIKAELLSQTEFEKAKELLRKIDVLDDDIINHMQKLLNQPWEENYYIRKDK